MCRTEHRANEQLQHCIFAESKPADWARLFVLVPNYVPSCASFRAHCVQVLVAADSNLRSSANSLVLRAH